MAPRYPVYGGRDEIGRTAGDAILAQADHAIEVDA
jgi:hypothetical protein